MKKSRILAAAMASIALTGALASCGKEEEYQSENNTNVCVYGPPPVYSDEAGDNTADGEQFFAVSSAVEEQSSASHGERLYGKKAD